MHQLLQLLLLPGLTAACWISHMSAETGSRDLSQCATRTADALLSWTARLSPALG